MFHENKQKLKFSFTIKTNSKFFCETTGVFECQNTEQGTSTKQDQEGIKKKPWDVSCSL